MSDHSFVFNPAEAVEFGRNHMDAGTALHLLNHINQLDQLPEDERAPFGSEQRLRESFSRLAIQSYSSKRLDANRENAKMSTGPRTVDGLLRSSLNAVKHGLTGKSRLVADEEQWQYDEHAARMHATYQPVGLAELDVVDELSDTRWRLARIPRLEAGLYAKGRMVFRDQFADVDLDLQADLVEAEVHLVYANDLRNLHLQESRLRRTQDKLEIKLNNLKGERLRTEQEALQQLERDGRVAAALAASTVRAEASKTTAQSRDNGFVFANPNSGSHAIQPHSSKLIHSNAKEEKSRR
jgi:hypothetical protein